METVSVYIATFSVTIAAFTFIFGVHAWRREHLGRKKIELAEELLVKFYEAQMVIKAVRCPGSFHGEGESRERGPDESDLEESLLNYANIGMERIEKSRELFNSIYVLRFRYKALFQKDYKPFNDLYWVVDQIIYAGSWLKKLAPKLANIEKGKGDYQELWEKYDKIYSGLGGEDDEIDQAIKKAVAEVERVCREVLNPKPSLLDRLFFNLK